MESSRNYNLIAIWIYVLFVCLSLHFLFLNPLFCSKFFACFSLPLTNTQPEACCGPKIERKKSGKREKETKTQPKQNGIDERGKSGLAKK